MSGDVRSWWSIHASILTGGSIKTLVTDVLAIDRTAAVVRLDEIAKGMGGVVGSSIITLRQGDFGVPVGTTHRPCTYKMPKMEVDFDDKSVWMPYEETAPDISGTFRHKEERDDTAAP